MCANRVRDGVVLISVHDIIPSAENDVVSTLDWLQEIGIANPTLLITPFHSMKSANSFEKCPLFIEYLLSLRNEISLHGYSHQTKSGSPAEFQRMPRERMQSRLLLGITLMKKYFKIRPYGFIPPMWLAPKGLAKIFEELGMKYIAIGSEIHFAGASAPLSASSLIISQGVNRLNLSDVTLELELGGSIQLAIHPLDHRSDKMRSFVHDLIDRLDYEFMPYGQYLKIH